MSIFKSVLRAMTIILFVTGCGDDLPKKKGTPDDKNKTTQKPGVQDATKKPVTATSPVNIPPAVNLFQVGEGLASDGKKFHAKVEWTRAPAAENNAQMRVTFADSGLKKPSKVEINKLVFVDCCGGMVVGTIASDNGQNNVFLVSGINFKKSKSYDLEISATVDGTSDKIKNSLGPEFK